MYVTFRFEEQIFALTVLAHWHNVSFLLIAIISHYKGKQKRIQSSDFWLSFLTSMTSQVT